LNDTELNKECCTNKK